MPAPTPAPVAALLSEAARMRAAGRPMEALTAMRRAAGLDPDNPIVQHDLGLDCLTLGALAEAVDAFRRAVALKPNSPQAFLNLGIAFEGLGAVREALDAYRQATALKPSYAEAHFKLGLLLDHSGFRAEAVEHFRRAAATAPRTLIGRQAEALACLAERRDEEAERVIRQALAGHPSDETLLDLLGALLADAGRFEEAQGVFERLLEAAPHRAGFWYDLVRCRRISPSDAPLLDRLQDALRRPGLAPVERSKLCLAMGKALDDLGDLRNAMAAFDAADRERRRENQFDLTAFQVMVERLIARFGPEAFEPGAFEPARREPTPVFILGMPRSGTTLVEQILSCHPEVAAGGELAYWTRVASIHDATGPGVLAPDFLERAAADYLRELRTISPDAPRVTDKMPFNFLWVGLIRLAFPEAAIIHCRRRPIDTALSIHMTHFGPGLYFPTGGPELVGYYRAYERIMAHWRRVLPPGRVLEVDYEALTETPEPVIRQMLEVCGLKWDEACLHPERNPRRVATASKWQARQPIYRSAVDRWRRYEPHLGPLAALARE